MLVEERRCRISGELLQPVIDLGSLFISNFVESADSDVIRAPLQLGLCEKSGLLQLMQTVDRTALFEKYWYQSGTNATMPLQLRDIVDSIMHWTRLEDGDVVLDIGCNDGTLLAAYPKETALVKVGIDPARNLADKAKVVCTLHATDFFDSGRFLDLTEDRKAKVITSIAMFYSLSDPQQFVADVADCLTEDGIWIVQMSYTPLMVAQNAFDNICHEHTCYFTLQSMEYLVRQHGLQIVDVQMNEVNGGSFRLVITKNHKVDDCVSVNYLSVGRMRVDSIRAYERNSGYNQPEVYLRFMERVQNLKIMTLEHLWQLKKEGKLIYGYGASTKGNTLLQYYGLGPDVITAIAERQPAKWGLLTVGTWIPIVSEAQSREANPDYLFALPWHFVHEFVERERDLRSRGSRFILPLPNLLIL